jgi:CelD/BcsL family acetyltransferase involved in cellulose biosynthesis
VAGTASGFVRNIDSEIDCIWALRAERIPFLHPLWLRAWLAEFGDRFQPEFIACGGDASLAVAPLMRDDSRLTFVGDPSICDFMDFAVDLRCQDEAYDSLWRSLCREEWAELDLWGLRETSPTRGAITARAQAAGYQVVEQVEATSPRVALPATWEDYQASLGKKDRHELRRKLRRLFDSGAGVEFEVYQEQADVNARMDDFLRLHTGSRQDKAEFMSAAMEAFFRRMTSSLAGEGLVRLFMLRLGGRPAASVLCFDAGSALYMYNSGYDPAYSGLSAGLLSKALCLKWAIENGYEALDFLRGAEPYKYDLGARDAGVYRLLVRRS